MFPDALLFYTEPGGIPVPNGAEGCRREFCSPPRQMVEKGDTLLPAVLAYQPGRKDFFPDAEVFRAGE